MVTLDNYIYNTICEKTLDLYKKTKYISHSAFCYGFKNSLLLEHLDRVESTILFEISKDIELIYGLKRGSSTHYLIEYFLTEKWLIYEESANLVKTQFINSFS